MIQPPFPELDDLLTMIGEAGRHLSEIEASEGAAGNISVCWGSSISSITGKRVRTSIGQRKQTEMLPAALFFLLLFIVPESPRWLAQAGRRERALAILAKVSGRQAAEREMMEITQTLRRETGTFGELFQPGVRMALLVAVGGYSATCSAPAK